MAIRYKYPRTPHFPFSPGKAQDDITVRFNHPWDETLIITEKMDGENTTIGQDYVHARSIDSGYHPSRTWVNNFAAEWQWALNEDERICGENLYAQHSIAYSGLQSYFYGFSYWTGEWCHSWDETLDKFLEFGIVSAPVLAIIEAGQIDLWSKGSTDLMYGLEGFVARTAKGFPLSEFHLNVAKFVRANHVQTDEHWLTQPMIKNEISLDI